MKFNNLYKKDLYIGLEMTRRCNMSCFYCHVRRQPHRETEMTVDEWISIITPILKYLQGYNVSMHFAGGEPFLYKGTIPLMKFLNKWNVNTSVVSNGLEVPHEIFSEPMFKDESQFCFNISLDGAKQGHETSRLNFDKVSHNFEKLIGSKIIPVVRTTAHKKNLLLIEELFCYVNDAGKRFQQKISIDVQPVGGSPHLVINDFEGFRLNLDEYLSVAWDIHLKVLKKYPYVKSRWRFLDEMIFSFFPESRKMISEKGAIFGCAGGFSFEIHANGDVARCEMDNPIGNLRYHHKDKDIEKLFQRLEKLNSPLKRCILCKYRWSCGMCRLSPVMHGYTSGFDYTNCVSLMRDVEKWHLDHRTAIILSEYLLPEEKNAKQ